MKEKIMVFFIGLLVGAVISTGICFVYTKATTCNNNNQINSPGGTPPSMSNSQSGQPPEKPSGEENAQPSEGANNTQNNSNNEQKSN